MNSCSAGQLSTLQEQYKEAFGTIKDQKNLITQLEEDLRSVNALSSLFRGDAEVQNQIQIFVYLELTRNNFLYYIGI